MQNIVERTEELVREAGIRTQLALQNVVADLAERRREERGQTAVEYMGILSSSP